MQPSLIDHWSYSSLTLFLRNRLAFKKKYILKIYDDMYGPSAVVGQAAHKALELYFKGMDIQTAIQAGLDQIDHTSDSEINFGKTGSREKMLKDYTQAVNAYFQEMPKYKDIVGVEKSITQTIKDRAGRPLGIPAKSLSDLIIRNDQGEMEVIDHKFVACYSESELDKAAYIIQAMFNFHTIEAEFGEIPKRMIFNECKIAKNKDSTPQLQPYIIDFEQQPENFALFYNIYNDCTREISKPDVSFLPNFQDMFDGQNSFDIYKANIIGVDAPVSVEHKTKQVAFADKEYIASAPDKLENQHLTEEEKIRLKLQEFGMPVKMEKTHIGPTITQYTLRPSRGIKMSQFEKLDKDIALALQARSIRIEAPIRGTDLVGIELPSKERRRIDLDLEQHTVKGTLNIPIGINVYGEVVYKDLSEMPHLLIAGTTGSGKSVMINVIIKSLSEQMDSDALKFILIDPKRVELAGFRSLPHLMSPVIYDDEKAAKALDWLVQEMDDRYVTLEQAGKRSIDDYNAEVVDKMPKIVVVIDEFADLMLSGGKVTKKVVRAEVTKRDDRGKPVMKYRKEIEPEKPSAEGLIVRIAQKARAVGIHLILATQRPSADVVTGLVKANIPTKIAFMTTTKINSTIVLDQPGAEELLGKGDLLFLDPSVGVTRLQGLYV